METLGMYKYGVLGFGTIVSFVGLGVRIWGSGFWVFKPSFILGFGGFRAWGAELGREQD